ncbi:NIMA-related serine/threonine kinase 1 isoform 1 [Hibiscus syriacus]|uniref:NIMA-related serine/threonine kinase 1 isoform 1 n=1 Tax=Hibiscus syriacus TaxID=106335 RepID=A0A6A2XCW0_HIBSY|nr:NIMA-related serine/threonine kinase 1 isoform 1 [Hibiscus syriacus]
MFDGLPDQFIGAVSASSATARTTALLPLSFTSFDSLYITSSSNSHHHYHQLPPQLLQPLHQQQKNNEESSSLVTMNTEINERDQRSMAEPIDNLHHHHQPWSNDEVLALLRVRSSMETWFPQFTGTCLKLAELGFKRSADKCKKKFEEGSRYFSTTNCSKNYRIFSELEELCQAENLPHHQNHQLQQRRWREEEAVVADESNKNVGKSRVLDDNIGQNLEDDSKTIDVLYQTSPENNNAPISSDQDNKGNDDNKASSKNKNNKKRKRVKKLEMFKGDEENVAREEAWKKQEVDRIDMELEHRAKEQAVAGVRQATMIKFLSKFSQNGSSKANVLELGKRSHEAPLWERISQGMLDLGYKRSAKRCKEKWENINKYFRKTKDVNKKRSIDSRTCPYFHQLSTLYSRGTLTAPPEGPGNHPKSSETVCTVQISKGDETNSIIQEPGFEFEF